MALSFNDVADAIGGMDKTQLGKLRELIKLRESMLLTVTRSALIVGAKVRWSKGGGRHAGSHTGTIEKIGPKNVIVREDALPAAEGSFRSSIGLKWTIHPNLLEVVP